MKTLSFDTTENKKQMDFVSSLPSFPLSEGILPEPEYPQTTDETEFICTALSLADLREIKRWLARGNDVNSLLEYRGGFITPLEFLVLRIKEKQCTWKFSNSLSTGSLPKKLSKKGRVEDFLSAFELLVQSGALLSMDVWIGALQLRTDFVEVNPHLCDLLLRLDSSNPPRKGDFSSLFLSFFFWSPLFNFLLTFFILKEMSLFFKIDVKEA